MWSAAYINEPAQTNAAKSCKLAQYESLQILHNLRTAEANCTEQALPALQLFDDSWLALASAEPNATVTTVQAIAMVF
jgi:hypothetical protein